MNHHPLVSPWMLNEGGGVRATAERLRELARLLVGVEGTIRSTLGSAVTALGWQGQITDRADEAAVTARTMLTRLADCCEAAGSALLELGGAMSWHGPRLTELLADDGGMPRFGSPGEPTPRFGSPGELTPRLGVEPRDPVIGLPVQPVESGGGTMATGGPEGVGSLTVEPGRQVFPVVEDRERLILQHVEDLQVHDQRCHDRLTHLRDELESMFPHGITPQFLRSLVPSEVWRQLVAAGVVQPVLPIQRDRGFLIPPRLIGPIRRTLPVRRELLPGCIRVVPPPRHTLPIHEDRRRGDYRVGGPGMRHTLPIREDRTQLHGAESDPGPSLTVQPADR